jgi:hypothetical protein
MKRWPSIPLFLFSLALTGCAFFSAALTLRVRLPEPPPHWQDSFTSWEWLLCFPGPDGGPATRILAAEEREASITVPKQRNLPVTATIVLASGLRLPPAGGIYPLDASGDFWDLDISWQNGFAAELLSRLIGGGVEVAGLNSRRLAAEIWDRSAGDPWRLDMNGMAQALATGGFTVYAIRLLAHCSATVTPGTGRWFLESPFAFPLEADADGVLALQDLPVGTHTLFALGGERRYLLSITEAGDVVMVPEEP